jgi:uncharacterized protein
LSVPAGDLTMPANLSQSLPIQSSAAASPPWWRVGMVWLVLGGPAVVVVAAIGTAVVAYRGADPVLTDAPTAQQAVRQLGPDTPAIQARNHAATPAPR